MAICDSWCRPAPPSTTSFVTSYCNLITFPKVWQCFRCHPPPLTHPTCCHPNCTDPSICGRGSAILAKLMVSASKAPRASPSSQTQSEDSRTGKGRYSSPDESFTLPGQARRHGLFCQGRYDRVMLDSLQPSTGPALHTLHGSYVSFYW